MKRLIIATVVLFGLSVGIANAGSVYPDVPKATGEAHSEGNEYWRVNHMDLLRHDRDATVHDGERDTIASLSECVTCHAVNGADAKPVTIKSEDHFCRVCHDYAAVKVDCFQCHNSLPADLGEASLMFTRPEDAIGNLLAYLDGVSR